MNGGPNRRALCKKRLLTLALAESQFCTKRMHAFNATEPPAATAAKSEAEGGGGFAEATDKWLT